MSLVLPGDWKEDECGICLLLSATAYQWNELHTAYVLWDMGRGCEVSSEVQKHVHTVGPKLRLEKLEIF